MIDGICYLYVHEGNRSAYVARYTANEMSEVFSAEEVVLLATKGKITRRGTVYVNMGFAAQRMVEAR